MKRLALLITVLLLAVMRPVHAQYYSVNYDTRTVAAMAAAFGTEAVAEGYYREQVDNILKHYNAAEVAAAGIFASKFLEHKAFSDLGIWCSSTENYYYRRICRMVAEKIMPKIWVVAKQMLHSPQTAIYWGSYLMKICDETKSLCMQFESVVTNSTLSFSDIVFLEINRDIAALLKLSEIGGIDWQRMLDDLAGVPGNFTKENLQHDIDNLYNMGVGLATAGIDNIGDALLQTSSFHNLIGGKVGEIINLYDHYHALFEQAEHNIGGLLIDMVGGEDNVAGLFDFGNYDLTSWITDYLDETAGNYYTQRWYIARREQGSISLCDYYPPTDDNSILNGGEWARFETTDPGFYPNASQREQALSNSEGYAGWSRNRVQQLNNQNDGYTYSINYWMSAYVISRGGKQTKKAYAYEIHVKKSWNREEVIYEDVFDSYSMDLNTFKAQLNARLSEFNDNEDGYTYYIASDARNYYQATDAAKLQGCESVTISVTCSDGATLGQGSTQYKCRKCGSSLNAHSKECAMQTTVSENDLDLSELDALLQEAENKISALESQINALENENASLLKLIAQASVEDAATYRQQYNANKTQIDRLKSELAEWQKKKTEYADAKTEAAADNDVATDDYYRIPAIMQDCKTAYSLSWQDGGAWSGYSYIRKATMPNINGIITFKATLSIARKPKYFLGIKIHRAILQISWELTTEYSDTHVADVLTLDPNMSDAEKTKLVNDRIAEIAREYPSCKITTEYARTPPLEESPTGEVYHLLWSSDRLEIAREVDSRITQIYADLVSLEKMMYYKRSIIDVLKDVLPELNTDEGRRLTLVEECHDRWIENARNLRSGAGRKEVRP
ncbi:hypothetical protein PRABACTJOHN_03580 [Parabacteroides johnsonii DSM 18315]|uniref:Uncharacterized protein n=1 Tax=Parabacteroides johnsonii DSM 18315 TaxID=537006 RepID=B7BEV1_9BACT|nr:hypothetical protein [Parabacteroides johnsonii]EEC95020.1 hypothetical protein PRABACTJOHN_03580 [Parabacteroides johnsonii DSM 18315]UEA91068.1 hypothetical protein LK449_02295 [Parabacteroides johnsonii]UWP43222.1 hypothetical protein NQ564_01260 [Parabacteroides johnsonii DSM 18315]